MIELREELPEEEVERRKKHLLPVDKRLPRELVVERAQKHVVKTLLDRKKLPLISARYFNWKTDQRIWAGFGDKDAEFPPAPPLYAPPYSTTYAKAYFAANPGKEEEDKGEKDKAGDARYFGFARASTQVVDPADEILGDVVGVKAWRLTEEPSRFAPVDDKVRLYQDLIGKSMPYQEGCGPFQVECPFSALGKDFETCFGGPREGFDPKESLTQLLGEASLFMGGPNGVRLFAKFRDLPNGDRRVNLFLDWHELIDVKNPIWQRVLYKAWCALLSLFHNQLRGVRVSLMDHLRDYYGEAMREHLMLYSRIGAAAQRLELEANARKERMGSMGGDEGEMEAKLDRLVKKTGSSMVAAYVKAKPNLAEKIREMIRLRDTLDNLTEFGNNPNVRLMLIRPTAEKILAEQVRQILEDPDVPLVLSQRREQFIAYLDNPDTPWRELLPRNVVYRIVSAGISEYQGVHGSE